MIAQGDVIVKTKKNAIFGFLKINISKTSFYSSFNKPLSLFYIKRSVYGITLKQNILKFVSSLNLYVSWLILKQNSVHFTNNKRKFNFVMY